MTDNNEYYETLCVLKGKRKGGTIDNWEITKVGEPSEKGTGELCFGRIIDDDWHGTGMGNDFRSSQVVKHYVEDNILETRNTFYLLGKPLDRKGQPRFEDMTDEQREEIDEAIKLLVKSI